MYLHRSSAVVHLHLLALPRPLLSVPFDLSNPSIHFLHVPSTNKLFASVSALPFLNHPKTPLVQPFFNQKLMLNLYLNFFFHICFIKIQPYKAPN